VIFNGTLVKASLWLSARRG